ncbi:MAG: sodium:solute symporter family protein [Balneolaceae bacterium]
MHPVDLTIFIVYIIGLLGFGYFFFQRNESGDDYYVGGRKMKSYHVGLSVVATDVGGGFSIGLGGLGFVMGISGSWMLFTGLIGAWLAAVFLIPKVKGNRAFDKAYTFPQVFEHYYSANVALVAAFISAIGYAGFTSSQMLAGAKLASGTFADLDQNTALYLMGAVAIIYTVLGGLKAVIYTDTIQWALLMIGLVFVGIPISYIEIGGMEAIRATVSPEMLSLTNVSWQEIVYWAVTIIPIWFVGMTLYQRIYACNDEKTAKRAWYLAGVFEWPIMAFLGVLLGLFARVAADQGMFDYLGAADISDTDPETGLPMLLRTVLPVGFLGIMMAAYFSAILSTADSCLMASSGNVVTDIIGRFTPFDPDSPKFVRISQVVTLVIGAFALILAASMTNVLNLMLDSYAFMVSGLFVPVIGALFWKNSTPAGAMTAMIVGGSTTIFLRYSEISLPFELDPNVFGITASAISFIIVSLLTEKKQ